MSKHQRRGNQPPPLDYVATSRDHLRTLGFSQLRIDNAHRFGWRYWTLSPDGFLSSPIAHSEFKHPTIAAVCTHGNEPPSPACSCGVFYIHDLFSFIDTLDYLDTQGSSVATKIATWGVALNDVALDRSEERWAFGLPPHRTGKYRVLGIMVGAASGVNLTKLRAAYAAPLIEGISLEHGWAIEANWDASAPGTFTEVRARYARDPVSTGTTPDFSKLNRRRLRESSAQASKRRAKGWPQ